MPTLTLKACLGLPGGRLCGKIIRTLDSGREAKVGALMLPKHEDNEMTGRTTTSREAAEAAFKAATTKPAEPSPKKPSLPGGKEQVSLRIDRDVLDYFQEAGPGWQERINEALRKAAGK